MNGGARKILVHATNVKGIGAVQVVNSLIAELTDILPDDEITIFVSERGCFHDLARDGNRIRVISYPRRLPNSISRLRECLAISPQFRGFGHSLILGDLPLRGLPRQTILVHQPHLVSPRVNPYSSSNYKYFIVRMVFRHNLRYVGRIIVQSGSMMEQLISTYSELKDRVVVIPQPAPSWLLNRRPGRKRVYDGRLCLFYPAAGYPHKNHGLIARMADMDKKHKQVIDKLVVTLDGPELNKTALTTVSWVKNLGSINANECLEQYSQTDALFFPSFLESYGLPLVEAMTLGLPVVCADLPYARWLCEEEGIYFHPDDPAAAWQAIRELQERLESGWQVNWEQALRKLPADWRLVAKSFAETMGLQ